MAQKKWITQGFDAFRRGTFGNGGHNIYVSKQGILQRIFQYDLNRDGYVDLVFANCQNHGEYAGNPLRRGIAKKKERMKIWERQYHL